MGGVRRKKTNILFNFIQFNLIINCLGKNKIFSYIVVRGSYFSKQAKLNECFS